MRKKPLYKILSLLLVFMLMLGTAPFGLVPAYSAETALPVGTSGEITAFAKLAPEIMVQNVPPGTEESGLNLPETLTATVRLASDRQKAASVTDFVYTPSVTDSALTVNEGDKPEQDEQQNTGEADASAPATMDISVPVTWTSSPEYDGNTENIYIFAPMLNLPASLHTADTVTLPAITVTVEAPPLLGAAPLGASAASDITAHFTDANFLAAVRSALGKGDSDPIYDTDVSGISILDVSNKNISSLAGIRHFTSLIHLNCSGNQLTTLDVSGLTGLTTLYCYENQLNTLDVSGLTGLTTLHCYENRLTTLDVNGLTGLTYLYCHGNHLTTLDVSGLTKLTVLNCIKNQLTMLDVSGLTKLIYLDCSGNQLTTLNVSGLTGLKTLGCVSNQLTMLDVSGLSNLTYLYCHGNHLTTLNVSGLTKLTDLYCYQNQLTVMDVRDLTMLATLNCNFNYMNGEADVIGLNKGITTSFTFEPQHASGFKAVTNITGLPSVASVGIPLTLAGTVIPSDATNQTIIWSIVNANGTGASISGSTFTATAAGTAYLGATIINGAATKVGYAQNFNITVNPAPVTVTSVTVKTLPTKTTYTAGDFLDLTGLVVTLHKSNGTSEDVTFADFAAKGITTTPMNGMGLSVSDTSVNITYTADSKSVSQSITVNPDIDAIISPTSVNYDLNAPADVVTTITWNSAGTVTDVVYGTSSLTTPDAYVVSGNALTIKNSYINTLGISKGDEVKFKIFFDKGNFVTLTVNIIDSYVPSSNAKLSDLTVNGSSIGGFDSDRTIYNMELPYNTPSVSVGAVPQDAYAAVVITQAQVLPGEATVVVTAEDKTTTKSYTIHFTLEAAPDKHSITVESDGSGTASANIISASKGTEIILTATPDSGYCFKKWQIVEGGVTIANNKFVMPDSNVTVKAIFAQTPRTAYQVTINGSYAATSGAGSYYSGDIVTVNAGSRGNYTFSGWTSTDGITFSNTNSMTTTFTMPAENVTITASWSYSGDSGGSSGGGGSGGRSSGASANPIPTITLDKKPDQPVSAAYPLTSTVDKSGKATVTVPLQTVKDTINKAATEADKQGKTANGIGVSLQTENPDGTKALGIILTQPVLKQLTDSKVQQFEIDGSLLSISFDLKALHAIRSQSTGAVTISLTPVTGLSDEAKALIGTRRVYNITLSYEKDGKTVNITSLGKGRVILSIPYTPGKKEAVRYLFGVYVDGKGQAIRIDGSTYDADSKSIIIDSNHLSVYGVGYAAPSSKLTDITSHWAKESIDYVVDRGLFSGTLDTTFSPDIAMSRGMLVTSLGRLADADVRGYKTGSFTDVKTGSTFLPYIEWAYEQGIVESIGNNQFAPDRAVTREEIALILSNYAKVTGYTLPVTREAVTFADAASISSSFKDAVKAMQQAGIMMGGDGNKFNPKAHANRAEVSAMLHRYIKLTIDPATAQGWAVNDAGQRLYSKDGQALTGWQTIENRKYFFDTDGVMQTGWKQDNTGKWYYLSGTGAVTGWLDIRGKRYYFDKDCVMIAAGWLQINGKWYLFKTDGSLALSTTVDGYEVDENGARIIER